jgi:hypothetical protein
MNVHFRSLVVGQDWDWVYSHMPLTLAEDLNGIIAEDVLTGERYAAIVLYGWTKNSCMAHVIITNPIVLRHGLVENFKWYVFDVCERNIVIGVVPSDNKKALKFDAHIGFKEVYRIKDGYEIGNDMVVMELRRGQQQEGQSEAA